MRCRLQPPSQHTRQSPNREPSVTGVLSLRYFVSSRMVLDPSCGPHMHGSKTGHSQVGQRAGPLTTGRFQTFGHPNDFLSPWPLTALFSDGARLVRHRSPATFDENEHKPLAIT